MPALTFEPGAVRRISLAVLAALLGSYLMVLAGLYFGQRSLLYQPTTTEVAPADAGLPQVKAHRLATPDGARLVLWSVPPSTRKETILYFHGNGGSLAHRAGRFQFLLRQGFGLTVLSYRGYGGSTGSPTEAHNIADARSAYDWLLAQGIKPKEIIVFGESLGSGVAVQLLTHRSASALMLDSPFSSITDVAAGTFWWLPVRLLLTDQYNSMAHIAQVKAPLFVLQGDLDTIVPPRLGRQLFAAAREPKKLLVLPHGEHTPALDAAIWVEVEAFLDRHAASRGGAQRAD